MTTEVSGYTIDFDNVEVWFIRINSPNRFRRCWQNNGPTLHLQFGETIIWRLILRPIAIRKSLFYLPFIRQWMAGTKSPSLSVLSTRWALRWFHQHSFSTVRRWDDKKSNSTEYRFLSHSLLLSKISTLSDQIWRKSSIMINKKCYSK